MGGGWTEWGGGGQEEMRRQGGRTESELPSPIPAWGHGCYHQLRHRFLISPHPLTPTSAVQEEGARVLISSISNCVMIASLCFLSHRSCKAV